MADTTRAAVFVDTGPWIALMDPRDQWRQSALAVMSELRAGRRTLVTTNLVLMEAYTGLVGRIAHAAIARLRTLAASTNQLRVIRVDESIEEEAWRLFLRHDDKAYSMIDCTSFVVMEQLGVTTAFTFDHHFRQAGFSTLPPPGV